MRSTLHNLLSLLKRATLASTTPEDRGSVSLTTAPGPRLPVAPFAIPLALLFSAACFAQTTTVVGDVKGPDGKPLVGAQIQLVRTDIKANYKVKTDKKGHYVYAGLPIGVFNISVEVDGAVKDQMNGVRTRTGPDPVEVSFDLSKSAAAAGAAEAPEANRAMSAKDKAEFEKQKKAQEEAMAKNKALNDAFNAGKDAVTAKNWDAAVDNFEKASAMGPEQHVVWSNLADAYLNRSEGRTGADKQSDLDKGIAAYAKAIMIKPDDPAYHNNYALGLAKAKKFDEAQAELTKAAQLDSANAGKYYYNLGAVYVNTGQAEPAGAAFKKAIDIDPGYADSYYQYGLYLIGKATTTPEGKVVPPDGTAEQFQKYLQMKPDGSFAEAAKAMLQSMGQSVDTSFQKPGTKKKK